MDTVEYAVIGAGLVGASIARSLAARGAEVAILEQDAPAGPRGSSHGSARIMRTTYPDPFYADLVLTARRMFDDLAAETGRQLITTTGSIDHGAIRDPRQLAAVLTDLAVDHELLSCAHASARWPQFRFTGPVLHHRAAGVIDPEAAVEATLASAQARGAALHAGWRVAFGSRARGGGSAGARVTLTSGTGEKLGMRRLIVAAGGWLPGVIARLPVSARVHAALSRVTVRQEQVHHFPLQPWAPADWPTFIHKDADLRAYGLPGGRDSRYPDPVTGEARFGIKVAEFAGGAILRDGADQTGRIDPRQRDRMLAFVSERLPGLVPEPYAESTCLFTSTPDEDFIIDTDGDITVVSACSGHGAKLAPATGELVAAALREGVGLPDRFGFTRR